MGDQSLRKLHDGQSGYLSQSRKPLYFGLGSEAEASSIEVVWPSGTKQTLEDPVPANQTLELVEPASS